MRWRLNGAVVGGMYIGVVEADTKEAAIEKGYGIASVSLCHQCSRQVSDLEVEEIHAELDDESEGG